MCAFKTILVGQGQSLADVAIEHCGSLDAMFAILSLNRSILSGITDDIAPATSLTLPDEPSKPAPALHHTTPPPSYSTAQLITHALAQRLPQLPASLVENEHEPLTANDPPQPPQANYYLGDDHVYHHTNGRWKRTPLINF
ncbi:MAG: hypothetical protein IPM52_13180 [Bacteroidetes bacterium]|nr:hypothetical protein [Bacteroidota bacterium]